MTSTLSRGLFLVLHAAVQLLLLSAVVTPNQTYQTMFYITSTPTKGQFMALHAAMQLLL
jgi:hypothetical protein